MKFHIYFSLCCLLLIVSLESCEKEALLAPGKQVVLSPEELLGIQVSQDLVFQLVIVEPGEYTQSGWILDRKGNLRTYQLHDDFQWISNENEVVTEDHLAYLLDESKSSSLEVEAEIYLKKYYEVQRLNGSQISDIETGQSDSRQTAIYAYRSTEAEATVEGCGGEYDGEGANRNFEKILIALDGPEVVQNESNAARSLKTWLTDLNEELH